MGADDRATVLEEVLRQLRRLQMAETDHPDLDVQTYSTMQAKLFPKSMMVDFMALSLRLYFQLHQDVQEAVREVIDVIYSSSSDVRPEERKVAFRALRATLMPNDRGEDDPQQESYV
jgi:hypothetical protein